MSGVPILVPALFAANGASAASGAKLYAYLKGTTTPQTFYTDDALVTPAANPTIANSLGATTRYLDPAKNYDLVAKSSDDATTLFSVTYNVDANNLDLGDGQSTQLALDLTWTDIASAATTDIGASTVANLRVTGTTTITAFGTADSGVHKTLRFASTPIITHNATSLILPGAANLKMTANDTMEVVSLGSGNWICTSYAPAARNIGSSAAPVTADASAGAVATSVTANYAAGTALANALTVAIDGSSYLNSGTGLISVGMLARGYCQGTWGPGASSEAGAVAIFTEGSSTRGGVVFGGGFHALASTTTGAVVRGIEVDTICSAASVASKINLELASPNADTASITGTYTISGGNTAPDSAWIRINAIGGGTGHDAVLFTAKPSGGVQPIPTSGKLWRAGGFTCANGLDWRDAIFSDNMIVAYSGNAKARITPKYDFDGSFSDFLLLGANYNTATATVDSASNGTALIVVKAANTAQGSIQLWTGASNTAPTLKAYVSLGLVVGSPTGGDKGAGTVNATAVYDDNVLLTCFVFDAAIDGTINHAKWHSKVPDVIEPAKPKRMVQKTEPRTVQEAVIEVIDGVAIQRMVEKTVEDPVTEELPVFDEDGNPVMSTLKERSRGPDVQATATDGTPLFDANGNAVMTPTYAVTEREVQATKTVPVLVEAPAEDEKVIEHRLHKPMLKFESRLGTEFDPLTLDGYAKHWKTKRHLSAFPNEQRFKHGDMSSGEWIQRLIEDAEIKAVLIEQLNQELKLLKGVGGSPSSNAEPHNFPANMSDRLADWDTVPDEASLTTADLTEEVIQKLTAAKRKKFTELLNVELAELQQERGGPREDLAREAEIEKLLGLFARVGEM